jgi:hypothetical protein
MKSSYCSMFSNNKNRFGFEFFTLLIYLKKHYLLDELCCVITQTSFFPLVSFIVFT